MTTTCATGADRWRAPMLCLLALLGISAAEAGSVRFFGNGENDIDRVKIRIDVPNNNDPGPPADIGATDITIELWIKGSAADNNNRVTNCGFGWYGWIDGDIFLDRDRFDLPNAFGMSLSTGAVTFGVHLPVNEYATVCGTRSVLDGQWHHVAVTRALSGQIRLFVDGVADGSVLGPSGRLDYPDDGMPVPGRCGSSCINSDPFLVLGAEKHDAVPRQLAFNGLMDELRLSTTIRYAANFTPPTTPFNPDVSTAALYHFDGAAGSCPTGTVVVDAASGQSPGECRFGGTPNAGPVYSNDSPFTSTGPGTLQFSAASVPIAEDAQNVTLTVTRTGGSTGAVSVTYATANGTATAGNDYTAATQQLDFADGQTGRTINIGILDDAVIDPGESFTVTLSAPTNGATLGTPQTATVTITDNDSPGTLQLSAAAYAVTEGTPTRIVTVMRISGSAGAVTVNYATADASATQPGDYTTATGTLSWGAGSTTPQTFAIPIVDDTQIEAAETFTAAISGASGGATLGSPATATVTINDNDSAGSVQFSAGSYTISETGGSVTITVNRTGGTIGPVSVNYASSNGTATSPADYAAASGTLNWMNAEGGPKTFAVTVADDAAAEGNETLNLALANASGGAVIGAPGSATLTITDNDIAQPGTLQLTQASYAANENAGTLAITVSRVGGTDGLAQVRVASTDGTALAGSDFQLLSQTLSWASGEGVDKTATLTLTNDQANEQAETFTISLSNVNGATLGTPASATVTINDDDAAGGGPNGSSGGGVVDIPWLLLGLLATLQRRGLLHFARRQGILP